MTINKNNDTNSPAIYRQGDVMLVSVGTLPEGAVEKPHNGRVVLAEGEVTGHAHTITAPAPMLKEYALPGTARRFLSVEELLAGVDLTHQEHSTITLPPGVFEIVPQCEWSDDMEPRRVLD